MSAILLATTNMYYVPIFSHQQTLRISFCLDAEAAPFETTSPST
jgi:hypothetical protein